MRFTKMHGLGNDFVCIDAFEQADVLGADLPRLATALCDRRAGVGGDGLIVICPPTDSHRADVRMWMLNSDGSEAEMCGNGVRCVAKYVLDHGLRTANPLRVETRRGILAIRCMLDAHHMVAQATVDMGEPILDPDRIPVDRAKLRPTDHPGEYVVTDGGNAWIARFVSMGNPHMVVFLDTPTELTWLGLQTIGPRLEHHRAFPNRMNVHFASAASRSEVSMRSWERGAGLTLACGTGACAVVVAGVLGGRLDPEAVVHLPGGDLHIVWASPKGPITMTGPAVEVFTGDWPIDD
ncbi:MAG: diaminopimelate epimerase [Phycisphaerales bacterium]|nr:diaminopimelate epimerase [Phycisphaerales bacterium]